MEERQKMAFEFAADYTKQLITLATGILAFTITFLKDIHDPITGQWWLVFAWIAFGCSIGCGIWAQMGMTGTLGSVKPNGSKADIKLTTGSDTQVTLKENATIELAGGVAISTHTLQAGDVMVLESSVTVTIPTGSKVLIPAALSPSIAGNNMRFPALLQITLFLIGIILSIVYGYKNFSRPVKKSGNHAGITVRIRETNTQTGKIILIDTLKAAK
ncbi:hypothetical protein [Hufsiella ginkgonis]|uniref:Uncharacterized protein n=1 Tax=Hufsiella ginkgonis TaxID=2695274 RepID=A0A7K1XUQ2_9SPHI|nr:hypothetical protein [Hufsiella ginkgonis]MXV14528.1 hypothetical protein [Hufsiella ginkgonis]